MSARSGTAFLQAGFFRRAQKLQLGLDFQSPLKSVGAFSLTCVPVDLALSEALSWCMITDGLCLKQLMRI